MHIDPKSNLIFDEIVKLFKSKDKISCFLSDDYDKCSYQINLDKQSAHKLSFSFRCYEYQTIFAINGEEMLKKYYSDLIIEPKPIEPYNLTLSIDLKSLPSTESKDDAQKKQIKKQQLKIIKGYAEGLSRFRRNFYAAPFEKAFEGVKNGKAAPKSEHSCRSTERIWIIPGVDQVTVFFGISFEEGTDKSIAKLILYELEEARRQVKNAPSVTKMHEDRIPEALVNEFPNLKGQPLKFSNGLIGMTLFKHHIIPNYDKPADFLSGFRQYLHYHIHASKTYLHGRIRKKVSALKQQINLARFEDEGVKYVRSDKGDNVLEKDEKEEVLSPSKLIKK